MKSEIIVGIDPGSRALGYGVVEVSNKGLKALEWGVLKPKVKDLAQRLCYLSRELENLFSKYQPQHIAVEKVFLGKNPDSAFVLGHARGVVLAASAKVKGEISEYAARSIKKSVTGNGNADKEHVRKVVEALLKIQVAELDATDALSMAIAHSRELEKVRKFEQQGVQL